MKRLNRKENVQSYKKVKALEATIASILNAQNADISLVISETQANINHAEHEIERQKQIIIAKNAEQERRVAAIHDAEGARLEELRRELADLKHELAVMVSPVLALPQEVTAEIFRWHALIGGRLPILLLVCKRWTAAAYSTPHLWSKLAVTSLRTSDALWCMGLEQFRLSLARTRSTPLQIKFGWGENIRSRDLVTPTSFWHTSLGLANRTEAIKIILCNSILRRCTYLHVAANFFFVGLSAAVEGLTTLPLLSSVDITALLLKTPETRFIGSLMGLSPCLRHIRCTTSTISLRDLGADIWAKRIETYGWRLTSDLWDLFHESLSLRKLGVEGRPIDPITLPALQEFRWRTPPTFYFPPTPHFITAPQLHTLMIDHSDDMLMGHPPAGSFTLPNLRIAMHSYMVDLTVLHAFHTPALEHLSIQSRRSSPTDLLHLFNGSGHMPTPKSLDLNCLFTDAALIVILGELPQLEEFCVAGGIPQDAFWEGLTPSCNPDLLESRLDERTTDILVPNLEILLVDNSRDLHGFEAPNYWERKIQGREWTITQASAVAVARKRAGSPLKTLACWSPEEEVTVLIGSIKQLPRRPTCVLFITLWFL